MERSCVRHSLRRYIGRLDELRVFCALLVYERLELFRRAAGDLETGFLQAPAQIAAEGLLHLGVEPADNVFGRGRGRHQRHPAAELEAWNAGLAQGWDVGQARGPLRAGYPQRPDL